MEYGLKSILWITDEKHYHEHFIFRKSSVGTLQIFFQNLLELIDDCIFAVVRLFEVQYGFGRSL